MEEKQYYSYNADRVSLTWQVDIKQTTILFKELANFAGAAVTQDFRGNKILIIGHQKNQIRASKSSIRKLSNATIRTVYPEGGFSQAH